MLAEFLTRFAEELKKQMLKKIKGKTLSKFNIRCKKKLLEVTC
jgi:hypothetical protein